MTGFTKPPEIVDMHFESDSFKEAQSQGRKWHDAGLYVWFSETEREGVYRVEASSTMASVWGTYYEPDGPMLFFVSDSIAPIKQRAVLWASEGIIIHGTSEKEGVESPYFLTAEMPTKRVVSEKEWTPK